VQDVFDLPQRCAGEFAEIAAGQATAGGNQQSEQIPLGRGAVEQALELGLAEALYVLGVRGRGQLPDDARVAEG
jgi:hypothetical protein